MTKMTYVDAIARAISILGANAENDEIVNRLNALKMTLEKRANTPRKPSAKDIEKANADNGLREQIRAELTGINGATAKELADAMGLSVQKVSALLRGMPDVVANRDGRSPVFALADAEEVDAEADVE